MTQPYELTACDALDRIRSRELSAEELLLSCLGRIEALEPKIGAWAHIDTEAALEASRKFHAPMPGSLFGIPIGIKDVIDTADMPTEYGTPIFKGHRPATDAACVVRLKEEGAIILGKTITQSFACSGIVRTANPLNTDHTSGGSSSGSAAAVAAKMVPISIGTQSASSTIRPASYTGLVGMRPSHGLVSVSGFKPYTASCDTIGLLGRSVDDVELMWCSLMRLPFQRNRRPQKKRPTFGICRPPWLADAAEQSARDAVDKAERKLNLAGAETRDLVLPNSFDRLPEIHEHIHDYEGSRSYAFEYHHHRDQLDSGVRGLIERGRALPTETYLGDVAKALEARILFPDVIGNCDCIVTAAAPGEAPKGWHALGDKFEFLGNPIQSRAWTILHLPVVTVPCHHGPSGLPVGIQLIGRYGSDLELLQLARWVAEALTDVAATAIS
jgi:Asp-tRNA(Asn)/Glu-tRNA(Gln) amidotransferase A subunit family amidase